MSVKAQLVEDIDSAGPGAFEYVVSYSEPTKIVGMLFNCPCGCKRQGSLTFRPTNEKRPSWEWDGNKEAPTLSPSVHDMPDGVTHWHGWLQNGEWRSC